MPVKDEAMGDRLAVEVGRHLHHQDVQARFVELIARHVRPRAMRSDNGSELLAHALRAVRKRG